MLFTKTKFYQIVVVVLGFGVLVGFLLGRA
jgi:hypothetical protein